LDPSVLAFRYLALAVKVPNGLGEELCNIWPLRLQGVPQVVCRNDIRFAAFLGLMETQESYNIRGVGVEKLSSGGSIR